MKKNLDKIATLLSTIGAYFTATAIFPPIENSGLLQSKIDIGKLTAFLMLAFYLIYLTSIAIIKKSKFSVLLTIGICSVSAFLVFLFANYYPYVNEKVINVKFECGGIFLRGDSLNYSQLDTSTHCNFDSLSRADPKKFIQRTDCDPSKGWTIKSIEKNYNSIIWRYILTIFLFTMGVFALIHAGTKKILKP
jgi:hypothetical protein